MPSRELQYRVIIDTGSAQSQARAVRNAIESELRGVNVGSTINTGPAVAASPYAAVASDAAAATSALSSLQKVAATVGVAFGAQQIARYAIDLAQTGTQANRSAKAFEVLSGGAERAQANLLAIQRGSNNTVDSLTAMSIGTQATALGLAKTSDEMERLVSVARLIASISPTINDTGDALTQLALFASNETSFARADQLLLSASEVRDRMKELRTENENLTGSQAKLQASIELVEGKFGDLRNTTEAQVSGYERLAIAAREAYIEIAKGPVGGVADDFFNALANGINTATGQIYDLGNILSRIPGEISDLRAPRTGDQALSFLGFDPAGEREKAAQALEESKRVLEELQKATEAGIPGAQEYRDAIADQTLVILEAEGANDAMIQKLQEADEFYQRSKTAVDAYTESLTSSADAEAATAQARADSIVEQSGSIYDSLQTRAGKSVDVAGLTDTIAQLREARASVDQAVQDLIDSGVTGSDEIVLRLQQIQTQALDTFDALDERANNFSFAGIEQSFADVFSGLDISSSDFIPQLQEYRDQAISLFNEIAEAGGVATEEQVAQLDILSSAAQAVSGDNAYLTDIVRDLGDAFLEANPLVGQLVGQLYASEAAYQAGAISADVYNGRMAALGGQLLAYLTQAGAATSATYSLVDAFSALAGTPGFSQGFAGGQAIGNYFQSQENTRVRDEQRKAAEQARREAESAAKRAAREAESAAKKAARELEAGAKKARQELENAISSVPGLFNTTQVTEQDVKRTAAGVYQNKPDEYLRRLKAEVEQGKDIFANVSIDEAKQALSDLGVKVAADSKVAYEQFVEAWESGLLFFDKANIDKFIDKDAVQRFLDLQEKAKIGQQNIYDAFGAGIDGAVEAVQKGIEDATPAGYSGGAVSVGGGGAIPYTVPTTAQLIPMQPQTTPQPTQYDFGMMVQEWLSRQPAPTQGPQVQAQPTLGGFAPSIDVEALQQQLTDATLAIHTDIDEESFAATLEKIESTRATLSLRTDVNTESFSATIEKLESTKPTVTLYSALDYDSFVAAVERVSSTKPQLTIGSTLDIDSFAALLEKVGSTRQQLEITPTITSDSIASAVSLVSSSNPTIAVTPSLDYDGFVALVQRIGETRPVMTVDITTVGQGTAGALGGAEGDTSIADSFIANIGQQFATRQNFFYAQGQGPAALVRSGFAASLAGTEEGNATLIDPMLFGLTNSIRANEANFRQRGGTIGLAVISGLQQQLTSEQVSTSITAIGESIGGYLLVGILNKFNGIADAIGAQILNDLTNTVEEPAP